MPSILGGKNTVFSRCRRKKAILVLIFLYSASFVHKKLQEIKYQRATLTTQYIKSSEFLNWKVCIKKQLL
jgi:hypothetical protein